MAKQPSPFAGISLTDQTPLSAPGSDQRLFASKPVQTNPIVTTAQPRNLGTKEASNLATLQPRNQASLGTNLPDPVQPKPAFNLSEQPYHPDTFSFTDEELKALAYTSVELQHEHNVKATKNNVIRCALHFLLEDFRKNKVKSFAVQRLPKK